MYDNNVIFFFFDLQRIAGPRDYVFHMTSGAAVSPDPAQTNVASVYIDIVFNLPQKE